MARERKIPEPDIDIPGSENQNVEKVPPDAVKGQGVIVDLGSPIDGAKAVEPIQMFHVNKEGFNQSADIPDEPILVEPTLGNELTLGLLPPAGRSPKELQLEAIRTHYQLEPFTVSLSGWLQEGKSPNQARAIEEAKGPTATWPGIKAASILKLMQDLHMVGYASDVMINSGWGSGFIKGLVITDFDVENSPDADNMAEFEMELQAVRAGRAPLIAEQALGVLGWVTEAIGAIAVGFGVGLAIFGFPLTGAALAIGGATLWATGDLMRKGVEPQRQPTGNSVAQQGEKMVGDQSGSSGRVSEARSSSDGRGTTMDLHNVSGTPEQGENLNSTSSNSKAKVKDSPQIREIFDVNDSSKFSVGDSVEGQNSGTTGIVESKGSLVIRDVSGGFKKDETIENKDTGTTDTVLDEPDRRATVEVEFRTTTLRPKKWHSIVPLAQPDGSIVEEVYDVFLWWNDTSDQAMMSFGKDVLGEGDWIIEEAPLILGEDFLQHAQDHPDARGLHLYPTAVSDDVTEITPDNLGEDVVTPLFQEVEFESEEIRDEFIERTRNNHPSGFEEIGNS